MVEDEAAIQAAAGSAVAEPVAERDAPMLGTLADRDSAVVPAGSAVLVGRVTGAGLTSEFERAYPALDPVLALSANPAHSEYSRLPGPSSGCHNMDNA